MAADDLGRLIEETVLGAPRALDRSTVAERAGVPLERAIAYWRAMGFADVPDDVEAFTEIDVQMLERATALVDQGLVEEGLALQMTRVMGRAMSRIAGAQLDLVRDRSGGVTDTAWVDAVSLDDLETFLAYLWRRHLAATAERRLLAVDVGGEEVVAVGFADLVGFTAMSQRLGESELASVVSRFEMLAYDIIGELGGRIVKMLGDEVMFTCPDAADACEVALRIVEGTDPDAQPHLPEVRVGLAAGPVIDHYGDVFGTTPNLASRLVDTALPGTILVAAAVKEAAGDRYRFKAVRPQRLKGFGRTPMWVLRGRVG